MGIRGRWAGDVHRTSKEMLLSMLDEGIKSDMFMGLLKHFVEQRVVEAQQNFVLQPDDDADMFDLTMPENPQEVLVLVMATIRSFAAAGELKDDTPVDRWLFELRHKTSLLKAIKREMFQDPPAALAVSPPSIEHVTTFLNERLKETPACFACETARMGTEHPILGHIAGAECCKDYRNYHVCDIWAHCVSVEQLAQATRKEMPNAPIITLRVLVVEYMTSIGMHMLGRSEHEAAVHAGRVFNPLNVRLANKVTLYDERLPDGRKGSAVNNQGVAHTGSYHYRVYSGFQLAM